MPNFLPRVSSCAVVVPLIAVALGMMPVRGEEPRGPKPTPAINVRLDEADLLQRKRRNQEAADVLSKTAHAASRAGDKVGEAWALTLWASLVTEDGLPDGATTAMRKAAGLFGEAGDRVQQVASLVGAGALLRPRDAGEGNKLVMEAMEIAKAETERPLALSEALFQLGVMAYNRRDLELADLLFGTALARLENVAPQSRGVIECRLHLGAVAMERGQLDKADRLLRQALPALETIAPGSPEVALVFSNLGLIASERGNSAEEKAWFERALEIYERRAPNAKATADALDQLATILWAEGDKEKAERYWRRAMEIYQVQAPESADYAHTLAALARIEVSRGGAGTASQLLDRAVEVARTVPADSVNVARLERTLGDLTRDAGRPAEARNHYQRALELLKHAKPDSPECVQLEQALAQLPSPNEPPTPPAVQNLPKFRTGGPSSGKGKKQK